MLEEEACLEEWEIWRKQWREQEQVNYKYSTVALLATPAAPVMLILMGGPSIV